MAKNKNRDEFTEKTKLQIAIRLEWRQMNRTRTNRGWSATASQRPIWGAFPDSSQTSCQVRKVPTTNVQRRVTPESSTATRDRVLEKPSQDGAGFTFGIVFASQ